MYRPAELWTTTATLLLPVGLRRRRQRSVKQATVAAAVVILVARVAMPTPIDIPTSAASAAAASARPEENASYCARDAHPNIERPLVHAGERPTREYQPHEHTSHTACTRINLHKRWRAELKTFQRLCNRILLMMEIRK